MTGEELREFRLRYLQMNQADFGTVLGYHQPQQRISEFERGIRVIPHRVAEFAAEVRSGKLQPVGLKGQGQEKHAQNL